jgi:hypothetical protein
LTLKNALLRLACAALGVVVTIGPGLAGGARNSRDDPFQFLAPWIIVSEAEKARLDRDEAIVRTLSGDAGQLAVFVLSRLNAQADALVAWTRSIAELKRSKFVLAIRRFSDRPEPSDVNDLVLDESDLDAIRRCVLDNCALKLSAPEIESLTTVVASAGEGWRDAVQAEFRRLLVARVNLYRTGGLAALPPSADGKTSRQPKDTVRGHHGGFPVLDAPSGRRAVAGGLPHD